ncbi:catalase-like domain-containing protein [Microdochium bolleyi]|uniref:Catalase-like domain-containing protein n=1 Tax=Microdochium bolleyi TaxID=196109 RepID=A0A136JA39_9PEZI|nr:catalase-like domain-containing protein [Microdochium bolleyi]
MAIVKHHVSAPSYPNTCNTGFHRVTSTPQQDGHQESFEPKLGNGHDTRMTMSNGAPLQDPHASLRVGNQLRATLLLQDINLMESIQHLTHERIPERLVHAKGVGAYGFFEVTDDITDICDAAFLNHVGKKTELFARFSTVAREKGSPETVRDTRGFAFKMYTEEGNLDWLFLSTPVFPIRDGAKFPSFTHATKRDPQSNLLDRRAFWDYFTQNQEGINFLMYYFSDRATPTDFQHADCFSINTYRMVKKDGTFSYVRIHARTSQGVRNFTAEQAERQLGADPEHQTRQMFEALEDGQVLSWDVYAQVVDPARADKYPVNIFDPTKVLPECDFPLRRFGRIVLDRNVDNFHAETDQSAFAVTNMVPGWALTPDPILQTRCLAYTTAQRYRLSANFNQLPVNRAKHCPFFTPTQRDGSFVIDSLGPTPNYYPSSFMPPPSSRHRQHRQKKDDAPSEWKPYTIQEHWDGPLVNFESQVTDADFAQARVFWERELPAVDGRHAQDNFVTNVTRYMRHVKEKELRERVYDMFGRVNASLGRRIAHATEMNHMHRDQQRMGENYHFERTPEVASGELARCPFSFQAGPSPHRSFHGETDNMNRCPVTDHRQQQYVVPDVIIRSDSGGHAQAAPKAEDDWDMSACAVSPGQAASTSYSPSSTPPRSHPAGTPAWERSVQLNPDRGSMASHRLASSRSMTHLRSHTCANAGMYGY